MHGSLRTPVILLCAALIFAVSLAQAQIYWAPSLDKALPYAQSSKKNILLYLFTPEAEPCRKFQSQTLRDPALVDFINARFVSVAVNVQQDRAIGNHFGVYRVPTVLILDPSGREFSRFVTYYPADRLQDALKQIDPNAQANVQGSSGSAAYRGTLLQESFDHLYGWNNNGSSNSCTVQLSLVRGMVGSAFKVEYEIEPKDWTYVQFYKELNPSVKLQLPPQYTLVFHVAGTGGHNQIALKLIDEDFDNFGIILRIPTDFRGHRLVIPSTEIKYLWGDEKGNKRFDRLHQISVGIQPDEQYRSQFGPEPKGVVYLDELVILPGIRTDIPASDFTGRTD